MRDSDDGFAASFEDDLGWQRASEHARATQATLDVKVQEALADVEQKRLAYRAANLAVRFEDIHLIVLDVRASFPLHLFDVLILKRFCLHASNPFLDLFLCEPNRGSSSFRIVRLHAVG